MPLCGPKCSICGLLISAWGIMQLLVMGGLFMWRSVGLIEDLGLEEEYATESEFFTEADRAYNNIAYNCWIAALLYVVTLVVSIQQLHANRQAGQLSI